MAQHVTSRRWARSREPRSRLSLEALECHHSMPMVSMDVTDNQDFKDLPEDMDQLAMEVMEATVEAADPLAAIPLEA